MFYKIIIPGSFFADFYNDDCNLFDIPYGTILTAPSLSKHKPDYPQYLINESCLHFAEGAFDTMLWHAQLSHHLLKGQIYSIQPLTNVIKQRCPDALGLYQCGAKQIEILDKQDMDKMYELAIQEYYINPTRYTNFKISMALWKKHQTPTFSVRKSYCK